MSQAGQKMQMLTKDFKLAGIDEESKEFIANVATYSKEKGGFTVKVKGEQKLVSELKGDDLTALKEAQQPVTLEDLAREQLNTTDLSNKILEQIRDQAIAPGLGSRAPQDLREVTRAMFLTAGRTAQTTGGNIRGGIKGVDKAYTELGTTFTDMLSGKGGGVERLEQILQESAINVSDGFKRIGKGIEDFDYEKVIKPQISAGNKIYEAAGLVLQNVKTMVSQASAQFSKTEDKTKSGLPTTQSTNTQQLNVNPLSGQFTFDINVKNADGSTQKLSDSQTQQIINSEEFRKAIQKLVQDMLPKTPYSNVPSSVPGG